MPNNCIRPFCRENPAKTVSVVEALEDIGVRKEKGNVLVFVRTDTDRISNDVVDVRSKRAICHSIRQIDKVVRTKTNANLDGNNRKVFIVGNKFENNYCRNNITLSMFSVHINNYLTMSSKTYVFSFELRNFRL